MVLSLLRFSRIFRFCSSILQSQCWKTETLCNVIASHVQMTSFVNICDVKSAEKRYACLKIIVNNKTKMNMTCASSRRCFGSSVVSKKEFQLKGFISLEEINTSRQKQN